MLFCITQLLFAATSTCSGVSKTQHMLELVGPVCCKLVPWGFEGILVGFKGTPRRERAPLVFFWGGANDRHIHIQQTDLKRCVFGCAHESRYRTMLIFEVRNIPMLRCHPRGSCLMRLYKETKPVIEGLFASARNGPLPKTTQQITRTRHAFRNAHGKAMENESTPVTNAGGWSLGWMARNWK